MLDDLKEIVISRLTIYKDTLRNGDNYTDLELLLSMAIDEIKDLDSEYKINSLELKYKRLMNDFSVTLEEYREKSLREFKSVIFNIYTKVERYQILADIVAGQLDEYDSKMKIKNYIDSTIEYLEKEENVLKFNR